MKISRKTFLAGSATILVGAATGYVSESAPIAECIFIMIILVIAGYIIVKIIQWCKKNLGDSSKLPPNSATNSIPPSSPALTALPPILHNTTSVGNLIFQSSDDLRNWCDELVYNIAQNTRDSLDVVVSRHGTQVAHKTIAISDTPDGATAVVDLREESKTLFPKDAPLKSCFRVVSQ
jgi:hypothetical protein